MARPWRIEYDGAYYHILSRGNEGRQIYYDDIDRRMFLDTLGAMGERFEIDVFAFVLMSSHYHLLMRTKHANLSRAMQWLGVTYAGRFNNRHLRSGHLFQGRFKSILVENESYVVELSCYIHRNPLRAGTVKRLVDYRWSSYPVYAYGRKGPEWLKTDLILSFFSGEDSRKAYRAKVQGYAGEEKRLWEEFRYGVVMGTRQFVEKVRAKYVSERPHPEVPQQKGLVGRLDIGEFFQKASQLLDFDVDQIKGSARVYGEEKAKRDILVFMLWEGGAFTNAEIGEIFGVSYTAVSHIMNKVKGQLEADRHFKEKCRLINSQIKM